MIETPTTARQAVIALPHTKGYSNTGQIMLTATVAPIAIIAANPEIQISTVLILLKNDQ